MCVQNNIKLIHIRNYNTCRAEAIKTCKKRPSAENWTNAVLHTLYEVSNKLIRIGSEWKTSNTQMRNCFDCKAQFDYKYVTYIPVQVCTGCTPQQHKQWTSWYLDVHNMESDFHCYFKMGSSSDDWEGGIMQNCYSDGKTSLLEKE